MKKQGSFKLGLLFLGFILNTHVFAQHSTYEKNLLAQQPNFLKSRLTAKDSLFIKDITVLKQFVSFDSVDVELLKPQLLYAILSENDIDSVVTYQTLITAVQNFRQGLGYTELKKGIILYRQMANIKVNPNNWANDQTLFRKLGFTEADLEDFHLFISQPKNKNLSYKEAYLAYMKEIDDLP